jgi:putative flippase GtrA
MTTITPLNSCRDNQLEEIRRRARQREFWQDVQAKGVAPDELAKIAGKDGNSSRGSFANPLLDNEMRTGGGRASRPTLCNTLALNDLRGSRKRQTTPNSYQERAQMKNRKKLISISTFARWSKFNFVGAIGIAVQFAALCVLKSVFHFNYLVATALAVEAAVLHNFVWHERFTWADRVSASQSGSGCAWLSWRLTLARLARFHLGNGAISILGNLALMKVMVGQGHMNYLVANAIAISLCALMNFLVSDEWVFAE